MDLQNGINTYIVQSRTTLCANEVDFSNTDTSDINQDIDILFNQLDGAGEKNKLAANFIKNQCLEFFKSMTTKLLELEVIIVLQAFMLKDKPIIDLFYKYENQQRTMRDYTEFCLIVGGGYMALFYKVRVFVYY